MKMYETTQCVEKYLNVALECDCGRTHYAPIRAVDIRSGAINDLPGYVKEYGYRYPYILCDKITYELAGRKCEELLKAAGLRCHVLIIKHLGFDEATLGEIVINRPDNCDLMIGCGTGSITDMLRYASFKLGLPCFTIPTAAPMDGFSASVGIMNVNNLKATMPAHSTEVIIGDTDILSGAPFRMTLAGFADLIGKLNALNDWHLAVLINGDHYCASMDKLISDYVYDILGKTESLKTRDPETIGDVLNALLLTGATISLYGSSRPISGAEHHFSHYLEVIGDQQGKPYAMHGEQVAVGTVIALSVAEALAAEEIDFEAARAAARAYDPAQWKSEIRRAYGSAAEAIIELEEASGKNETSARLRRIDIMQAHWEEIRQMLAGVYSSGKLRGLLKELGCPADPVDLGVTPGVLKDTLLYCKETRARYTVFQLAWDLGVLDSISDRIVAQLAEQGRV